jgi:hypothetical protein
MIDTAEGIVMHTVRNIPADALLLVVLFLSLALPAGAAGLVRARQSAPGFGYYSVAKPDMGGGNADSTRLPASDSSATVGGDLLDMGRVVLHLLGSPLRWEMNDVVAAGLFLGLNGGAILLDDEVRTLVGRNHSSFNDALKPVGNGYATVLYMGPAALGLYLAGVLVEDPWIRRTGQMLVETVLAIGVLQVPLSITVGRARPFLDEGNLSFKLFAGTSDDRASFFSGHSMVAFGFSTILSRQIDNPWATAGLYTLAALGPLSRMYIDKHWFSDVLFGSIMGVVVGNTIHDWHMRSESPDGASIMIVPAPGGIGVAGRF